ncbi:MAG: hypothetical protein ACYSXD_11445 [Planctomycetota bacterium]|jgi:hypothetical protein
MKEDELIRVKLPPGWSDYSHENPDGPATFIREINNEPSAFQVSFVLQKGGDTPNPSCEDLIEIARNTGEDIPAGDLVETSSGMCAFGIFGAAIFKSKETPRTQIWYLSDGHNFILATHICPEVPEPEELTEVQKMVNNLYISKRPFWKCR